MVQVEEERCRGRHWEKKESKRCDGEIEKYKGSYREREKNRERGRGIGREGEE